MKKPKAKPTKRMTKAMSKKRKATIHAKYTNMILDFFELSIRDDGAIIDKFSNPEIYNDKVLKMDTHYKLADYIPKTDMLVDILTTNSNVLYTWFVRYLNENDIDHIGLGLTPQKSKGMKTFVWSIIFDNSTEEDNILLGNLYYNKCLALADLIIKYAEVDNAYEELKELDNTDE